MLKKNELNQTVSSNVLWYCGLVLAMLSAAVGLLRLIGAQWAGHYHKVFIPFITIYSVLYIVSFYRKKGLIRLDLLSLCLFVYILQGVVFGILYSGKVRYFVSHLLGPIFMLSTYLVSYNSNWNEAWFERFWSRANTALLSAFAGSIVLFWTLRLFYLPDLYLGIGSGVLTFSLAYYLIKKKYILALIPTLLIVMTGKRGSLLAALVVLFSYIPLSSRKNAVKRMFIAMFSGLFILFILFSLSDLLVSLPVLDAIIARVGTLNFMSADFDPDIALSGRNQELLLAFRSFAAHGYHWFTGMGFGWSYFFDAIIPGSETTDYQVHYVHFAPANFFLTSGIPLTLLIFYGIWTTISNTYRFSRSRNNSMPRILLLFWIGLFVESFSGYSYPITPFFWLTLGALAGFLRQIGFSKRTFYI